LTMVKTWAVLVLLTFSKRPALRSFEASVVLRPGSTLAWPAGMRSKAIAPVVAIALVLIAPRMVRSDELGQAPKTCPGYTDHLRNARQYLERSERKSALVELKRARASLESCGQAQASETVLAACVPWTQAS
jgi:hypothetical protein